MEILTVSRSNDVIFYEDVKDNYEEYFFFRLDYAQYPEKTKIFIAVDNNTVCAMLLIWNEERIQVRGSLEGVEFLLKHVTILNEFEPKSVTGFEEHKSLIKDRYPEYELATTLYRMRVKRGEQNYFESHSFNILTEDHRQNISVLMKNADPVFWGDNQPDKLTFDENTVWFGISRRNKLVCVTGIWIYDKIGYITIVATDSDYKNKGLASSLISSALKHIFKEHNKCFIMVRVDNPPALHLYKKLGFKVCNTHYNFEKKE